MKILRGPLGLCLSDRSNKYKAIFLLVSFNFVLNNITRQVFPEEEDLIDIISGVGVTCSLFLLITISYTSEEKNVNRHPNGFEYFKQKKNMK